VPEVSHDKRGQVRHVRSLQSTEKAQQQVVAEVARQKRFERRRLESRHSPRVLLQRAATERRGRHERRIETRRQILLRPAHLALVVEAQSEVPRAMSQAFREGNLGIFDYYNMKNIKADTGMRDAISGEGTIESTKAPDPQKE